MSLREELLERDSELAEIAQSVADARRGDGRLVVIDGPAGIGKSRLLAAATAVAGDAGIDVLEAHGRELERQISFGLATDLFASRLNAADAGERRRLLAGQAGLASCVFDPLVQAPADDQALIRGLYWLAVNLATGPAPAALAIAIDDLQWCDRPSLSFLAYFAARVAELPVALVVAIRSGEPGSGVQAIERLRDRPGSVVLHPAGLSEAALHRMMVPYLADPEPAFVHACAEVSGGNPFLARELVRALREDGVPPVARSVATVQRLVPDAVLRAVLLRLARLPEFERRLAAACAVLGSGAELRHAAALAELDPIDAEQAADGLAEAHILEPGEPLSFLHPLMATAVYSDLAAFACARLHREAARLLAADGARPEAIAVHLLMSRPEGDQSALDVMRDAAGRALGRGDPATAVEFLRRALAEPPTLERRPAVLLELAAAIVQNGERGAENCIEEALELQNSPPERARSLAALARVRFQHGEYDDSARMIEEALDLLDPADGLAQALVVQELTVCTFFAPLRDRADARMKPILNAAQAGRDPEHPGLLAHLTLRLALGGGSGERVRSLAERATANDPLIDPSTHGMLTGLVISALAIVDELGAAEQLATAAIESARRRGALLAYASASYHRALARYHSGPLTDVLGDVEQALSGYREGWVAAAGWIGSLQARVHIERGELEAAREALELAASTTPERMDDAAVVFARAQLELATGEYSAALADAEGAGAQLIERFGIDHPGQMPWRSTAALAASAIGEREQAIAFAGEELDLARRSGVSRAIGIALRVSGLVADGEARHALLAAAVEELRQSRSTLERARALVDQGAMLRRAGQRRAAQAPLREGLQLADGLGAEALARSAREELRATGARPRRAAHTGVDALTPAELRVAQLAADGLTNPQIAQALFVTTRTVETHLAHAYRKLDIDSRRGLPGLLRPEAQKTIR